MLLSDLLALCRDQSAFYRVLECLFGVSHPAATTVEQAAAAWFPPPPPGLTRSKPVAAEICQRIADRLQPTSRGVIGREQHSTSIVCWGAAELMERKIFCGAFKGQCREIFDLYFLGS